MTSATFRLKSDVLTEAPDAAAGGAAGFVWAGWATGGDGAAGGTSLCAGGTAACCTPVLRPIPSEAGGDTAGPVPLERRQALGATSCAWRPLSCLAGNSFAAR